jgi:hypothetical protein
LGSHAGGKPYPRGQEFTSSRTVPLVRETARVYSARSPRAVIDPVRLHCVRSGRAVASMRLTCQSGSGGEAWCPRPATLASSHGHDLLASGRSSKSFHVRHARSAEDTVAVLIRQKH